MAADNHIERKVGDSYPVVISIATDNGAANDMTGATEIWLGVSATKTNTAPADADIVVTGTITDAAAGEVSFDADATDSIENLEVGDYWAEIQFMQSGYRRTTATFKFRVVGQIITS